MRKARYSKRMTAETEKAIQEVQKKRRMNTRKRKKILKDQPENENVETLKRKVQRVCSAIKSC